MKIDAHHHFWNPNERDYYWMGGDVLAPIRRPIGPDDMAPLLDKAGIGGTVLVQTIPSLEETRDFLRVAAEVPFVKGVVGWVDLTDPDVADTVGELQAGPGGAYLKGIRHQAHDEDDKGWMARADVIAGVAACGAAGLVQDLLPKEPELPACIACVDALPDVTFVVDHIAKPRISSGEMEPWLSDITQIAQRPNVYCKLSGMVTEADWTSWQVDQLRRYADQVLSLFGPDRVIFGSDWPVCLLAAEYADVVGAANSLIDGMDAHDRAAIQGGNAARVYGLDIAA